MSDDGDGCMIVVYLVLLVIGAAVTLYIFGDARCLVVDCVIVKP